MPERLPYVVEPMALGDIGEVMDIEEVSFSAPWSARAYRYEITENEHSIMRVVRAVPNRRQGWWPWPRRREQPVLGYAGLWLLVDDAHVATIAVHPRQRGRGLGELLLLDLLDSSKARGARRATLEVRVSNEVAQGLYHKYGFEIVAQRRRYYADNNEDAFIMATPDFAGAGFQANLEEQRRRLNARLRRQALADKKGRVPETFERPG